MMKMKSKRELSFHHPMFPLYIAEANASDLLRTQRLMSLQLLDFIAQHQVAIVGEIYQLTFIAFLPFWRTLSFPFCSSLSVSFSCPPLFFSLILVPPFLKKQPIYCLHLTSLVSHLRGLPAHLLFLIFFLLLFSRLGYLATEPSSSTWFRNTSAETVYTLSYKQFTLCPW